MIKLVVLVLFFVLGASTATVLPRPLQLPRTFQDSWIVGFTSETLNISAARISKENENDLQVIEIQSAFLNEQKVITADGYKRCNTCHILSKLHENVLSMQSSDCESQVLE